MPDPPDAGTEPVADCRVNVHAVPDSWTPIDCPLMVNEATRLVTDPALDRTVTPIVPLPVPDAGMIVAHAESLDALQEQFDPFVVTPIKPVPPFGPNGLASRDVSIVALHASPSCVTWNA